MQKQNEIVDLTGDDGDMPAKAEPGVHRMADMDARGAGSAMSITSEPHLYPVPGGNRKRPGQEAQLERLKLGKCQIENEDRKIEHAKQIWQLKPKRGDN